MAGLDALGRFLSSVSPWLYAGVGGVLLGRRREEARHEEETWGGGGAS